jgi:heme/copper-type cytochrome/quinol oxidase subunit 3
MVTWAAAAHPMVTWAAAGAVEAPPQPPVVRRANGRVPPPPPPTGGDDGDPREPRRGPGFDNVRLAMIALIGAELMFFAGLVSAFFVLRTAAAVWPPPFQPRLPVEVTGLNTLVLLASSVAMAVGARAVSAGDRRTALRGLGVAAALGATFVAVQGFEWVRMLGFGLTASSQGYGTTFYTLIGAHAAHVVGALVWLAVTLLLVERGRLGPSRMAPVRACAMYWHFVVALWPVLYIAVYLA